jgi:hypothetical protein
MRTLSGRRSGSRARRYLIRRSYAHPPLAGVRGRVDHAANAARSEPRNWRRSTRVAGEEATAPGWSAPPRGSAGYTRDCLTGGADATHPFTSAGACCLEERCAARRSSSTTTSRTRIVSSSAAAAWTDGRRGPRRASSTPLSAPRRSGPAPRSSGILDDLPPVTADAARRVAVVTQFVVARNAVAAEDSGRRDELAVSAQISRTA